MENKEWHPLLLDNDPDSLPEADPEIQRILQKRKAAIWDITRQLEGITYSGTGTKEELQELEENMRAMISEGQYGYKYIENFLLSIGYNLNKIRQTFKRLTGVDPQVYLDAQPYLDTPGTIPGINYGWGKSKDKQYDYYFIMPYNAGFSVFGQKGDLLREEVKYCLSLDEARDFLKKKVEELQLYDKVVKPSKIKLREDWQSLSDNWPLGTKTANVQKINNYLNSIQGKTQLSEKRAILENELTQGNITPAEFKELAIMHGLLEKEARPDVEQVSEEGGPDTKKITTEKVFDLEKSVMETPIEEEVKETTPQQFFERNRDSQSGMVMSEAVDAILRCIAELNESLSEFKVNVRSFKYISKEVTERIERTPEVGTERAEEYFTSSGVVSVLLDITDLTLPTTVNVKQGLAVFSIIDRDVVTSGTFKGADNRIYSLDESGMEKYFYEDRQKYGIRS